MPALSGNVKDSANANVSKLVRAYRRDSGKLVGCALSNPSTGNWSITTDDTTEHFAVVHDAVADSSNSIIKFALMGDGTNGSSSIVDSMGNAITKYGTPTISTARTPFVGLSSILFNGSEKVYPSSSLPVVELGSDDFRIVCWVYINSWADWPFIIDGRPASTNGWYPSIYLSSGTVIEWFSNSSTRISGTYSTGSWFFLEIARISGSTRMFIDGTQSGSTYSDSNYYYGAANRPVVGGPGYNIAQAGIDGNIRELIITVGTGCGGNTSNYTRPSIPFVPAPVGGVENMLSLDRLTPV